MSEPSDLLFFDTFSHESSEELNLDLVQFPKPVYVSEIRIIPLGARVQGDFPGGVRLGATNPSQFRIDFFVNDLSKPGASTFETLGSLEYCQNGTIHMECPLDQISQMPTDGLVLKGWYTTVTLAVYGRLTKNLNDPPVESSQANVQRSAGTREPASSAISTVSQQNTQEWNPELVTAYNAVPSTPQEYPQPNYSQEEYDSNIYRNEFYNPDAPKDPRTYHHIGDGDSVHWEKSRSDLSKERECSRENDRSRHSPTRESDRARRSIERDRERRDPRSRHRSRSMERERERSRDSSRARGRSRDIDRRERLHSRSTSRDREYSSVKGDYRPRSRDKDTFKSKSRSPGYREQDRSFSHEKEWDRGPYKRDYNRTYDHTRDEKRASSYEKHSSYDHKRSSSYDKQPNYERGASSYDKQLPYERHISLDKKPSPYDRVRDSSYDGRSPSLEDPRKKPRTPPTEANRRPRTPEGVDMPRERDNLSPVDSLGSNENMVDYSRSGNHSHKDINRLKKYKHSPSPLTDKPQKSNYMDLQHSGLLKVKVLDSQVSPTRKIVATIESPNRQADDTSMDMEEFEPILSDEEICDDVEAFGDVDFEITDYCTTEDIIKCYNPFRSTWTKYVPMHKTHLFVSEGYNKNSVMNLSFDELSSRSGNLLKLFELKNLSVLRDDSSVSFKDYNSSAKEEWVNLCEQLPAIISHLAAESDILVRIFSESKENLKGEFSDILTFLVEFCKVGLNFEFAISQTQPTYKIRHMKCGIRLVEALTAHKHSGVVVNGLLYRGIDLCVLLLKMYSKEYMALSIRLMILKSLDACLSSEVSIEHFLTKHIYLEINSPEDKSKDRVKIEIKEVSVLRNGYQTLIALLRRNPLSRIKFALNALLKKLNTYELLKRLRETVISLRNNSSENYIENFQNVSENDVDFIVNSLDELWSVYRNGAFDISQPKRFLPLSTQFEIIKDNSTREVLFEFFHTHKFLETCVFLLSFPLTYNNFMITSPIYELIGDIINSHEGLSYLSKNMDTTEVLFKRITQPIGHQMNDESLVFVQDISSYSDTQLLALEMAYRLRANYYVAGVCDLLDVPQQEFELVEKLQALYSLTFNSIGKLSVAHVLNMADNIHCLLEVFDKDITKRDCKSANVVNKYKTPAKSYAVDLTVTTLKFSSDVLFLTKFGKRILNAAKKYDNFDQSISVYLHEVLPYLKPLEKPNILSCDSISDIVEIIKGSLDNIISLPGEMITCLRILTYYSIPEYERNTSPLSEQPAAKYIELKYKYNILQLFSNDGVMHLVNILEKLTAHYDQPALHSYAFVSGYGLNLAHVMTLCLQLLNKMLTSVIQCRNTHFKDTTAIPIILQTYSLLRAYPSNALGYRTAQKACKEAIETLLAYTQPISEEANETETISKTLWTLMCGEIIKYILSAPYTFVPGLLVFSELLPLLLPIPTKLSLMQNEISKIMNNRKLWSAHLHTLSNNLTEMIQTICFSAYQPVTQVLRRVCVQIADLASNMALVVVRAVVDLILKEVCDENNALPEPFKACSPKVARLFSFLACLLAHSSIKCTMLHLIRQTASIPKTEERYSLLIPILCAVLKTPSDVQSHVQTQECVASIISSLFDSEISLLIHADPAFTVKVEPKLHETNIKDFVVTSDVYLSNALPPKEATVKVINATFEYLSNDGSSVVIISSILRTYFMLSEHDFGFYYFKTCLDKNKSVFVRLFNKVYSDMNKDSAECFSIFLELLRLLQSPPEDLDNSEILQFTPRTGFISSFEVSELIGFTKNEDHPILTLEKYLKERNADEDLMSNAIHLSTSVLKAVSGEQTTLPPSIEEHILPPAEPLSLQFANRAVCIQGDCHDERLSLNYWLNVPNLAAPPIADEEGAEADIVACDLIELANSELASTGGAQSLISALQSLLHTGNIGTPNIVQTARDHVGTHAFSMDPKHRGHGVAFRDKRPFVSPARGRPNYGGSPTGSSAPSGSAATSGGGTTVPDAFRSRPPNTSRPPSLHVDDFVALEGRGAQPTGPTGYNKLTVAAVAAVAARGRSLRSRGVPIPDRGRFASSTPQLSPHFRHMRGRGAWGNEMGNSNHFVHFPQGGQYGGGNWNHMGGRGRGYRGLRHMRNSFIR